MEALRTVVSAIPAFGGDGIASEDWSTPITGTGDEQTGNFGDAKQLIWYLLQNQLQQQVVEHLQMIVLHHDRLCWWNLHW